MAAELVRGENHPLELTRLEIRVSAGGPVAVAATLGDAAGRVGGAQSVAHPGAPVLPGIEVSRQAAKEHRVAVDLEAMPESVHRISVLLALPEGTGGPARFGAMPAPFVSLTGTDGTLVAGFTLTGLDSESAVVSLEIYRRQATWKVRAVGQGYAGGLAALFADQQLPEPAALSTAVHEAVAQGLSRSVPAGAPTAGTPNSVPPTTGPPTTGRPDSGTPNSGAPTTGSPHAGAPSSGTPTAGSPNSGAAPTGSPRGGAASTGRIDYTHPGRSTTAPPPPVPEAPPAAPGQPAVPVAGDATGWSMDERLYNQVWGMFEDLARAVAAYRSAVDFAESRQEQELDRALSDPRARIGGAADAARAEARRRHGDLVRQAAGVLDREVARLVAESEVVEPALPPAYARWDNPVWQGYRVPVDPPMAMRLGDLTLAESGSLHIPMLVRLPLERGLWIDSGRSSRSAATVADPGELRRLALESAVVIAARLMAIHPPGEFGVQVIDPAGTATGALDPLLRSGVLPAPPVPGAAGVTTTLAQLTRRVDLVQMAARGGAGDALPPDVDLARQLLLVHDFPHGFDDRAVTQLRYLADEGPEVGVHLLMVADREDAAGFGPLLDPLWRSLLRLTPVPDDHLADPWVGHAWTFEPPSVPPGSEVLHRVLPQVAAAREAWRR
ncbi:TerD family protein [Streptomyces sp. NPDC058045]|uniref:TerD family protein n=1 Tax=Streptomyces sp. NPDC058045 TaxID=3346311 RepID=UPI0036EC95F6